MTLAAQDLTGWSTETLQEACDRLNDECRDQLAALNAKLALKEAIRRELHGRIGRRVK